MGSGTGVFVDVAVGVLEGVAEGVKVAVAVRVAVRVGVRLGVLVMQATVVALIMRRRVLHPATCTLSPGVSVSAKTAPKPNPAAINRYFQAFLKLMISPD